jgi:hypothetical protein
MCIKDFSAGYAYMEKRIGLLLAGPKSENNTEKF